MKILITGATGLIGKALTSDLLQKKHEIYVVTRRAGAHLPKEIKPIVGDLNQSMMVELSTMEWDVVIHLLGESIAQRWTTEAKRKIIQSRVEATSNLIKSLKSVKLFIAASAIGIYGHRNLEKLTEESSYGDDFLAKVCQDWEEAMQKAQLKWPECRVVPLRLGLVLSNKGGALKKMILPFSLGLGGALGKGHQIMSWIHIDDLIRIFSLVLENKTLSGPINCVSPHPVSNQEWTQVLSGCFGRSPFLSIPSWALKLGLGEMSSVLLFSQNVYPEKLLQAGFTFKFPEIKAALENLIRVNRN